MSDGKDFRAMWERLTPTQRRFVVAMQSHATKKDAAESIGIAPQTTYNWNGDVDEIVNYIRDETALAMLGILASAGSEAAMVKVSGLQSGDEKVAQAAASEILDRNLGKPTNRTELTGADGGKLVIEYVNDWRKGE